MLLQNQTIFVVEMPANFTTSNSKILAPAVSEIAMNLQNFFFVFFYYSFRQIVKFINANVLSNCLGTQKGASLANMQPWWQVTGNMPANCDVESGYTM